ncbi:MAG: TlpA family protein disulfide reductase [Alistipes sp.]|nr:TlpA family protein disulfide reductase [Alistipes sp.]
MKKLFALICCLITINVAMAQAPQQGDRYIDVTLNNAAGQSISVSDLLDEGKWVLIDFWATWCGPCRGEIPHLKDAYAKFASKGFVIYGITLDTNQEQWKAFIKENNMNWINVWGYNAYRQCPAAEAYGVEYIPTNFLISPQGVIEATNLRGEDIEKVLSKYIE